MAHVRDLTGGDCTCVSQLQLQVVAQPSCYDANQRSVLVSNSRHIEMVALEK